jgi:uncharacterized protein YxeA
MKKLLIILAAVIAIAACNNASDRETHTDTTTTTMTDTSSTYQMDTTRTDSLRTGQDTMQQR